MNTINRLTRSLRFAFTWIFCFVCFPVFSQEISADFLWDSEKLTLVFPTSTEDVYDSVPIGNGECAGNVWIEGKSGDLLILLARTDSLDGFGRLLKPGRVRISFSPESPFKADGFRVQELDCRNGTLRIEGASPTTGKAELLVYADANREALTVFYRGEKPIGMQGKLELWRTERRDISNEEMGNGSDYGLAKGSLPFEEPDTVLYEQDSNSIVWFHRNTVSVWPVIMKQQGFRNVIENYHDPLLNRTFGGEMIGTSFNMTEEPFRQSDHPQNIVSAKNAKVHQIDIVMHTEQTENPVLWRKNLAKKTKELSEADPATRLTAHQKWWNAFWDRSSIRILSSSPIRRSGMEIPPITLPLRIGMSASELSGGFLGEMAEPVVYNRVLSTEEIRKLLSGEKIEEARVFYPDFSESENQVSGPLDGKLSARSFDGKSYLEMPHDPNVDLSGALTLACWVKPVPGNHGRLIDKIRVGSSEAGFLLDLHGGLRFLAKPCTLTWNGKLPEDRFSHIAATYDAKTGRGVLYVNAETVASFDPNVPDGVSAGEIINRGYALQRYVQACAGRGNLPMKFNGNLFTVEPRNESFNPDYRRWGLGYWTQNTRLMYWPMLSAGDFDLMRPAFKMYAEQLPLAKERNRIFLGDGNSAFLCETCYSWGLPLMGTFGTFDWDRPGEQVFGSNHYVSYHWNGGLEWSKMMLDYCDYAKDESFLKTEVVPFADAMIRFFDLISPEREKEGKMLITKATSLETWWKCTNPMPDVVGLHVVLDRLLTLPESCSSSEQRAYWKSLKLRLPNIPVGERTVDGKSYRMLLPAEKYEQKGNVESPELYGIFPFDRFGVARAEWDAAKNAFDHRWDKHYRGWGQDEIFAARLGLTEDAAIGLTKRFNTWADDFRFPAMWGPNFDWIPDQDHGGSGMIALQSMLMQPVGEKILLLPAWPEDWNVEFKLHAPGKTVVRAKYVDGKLLELNVEPKEREKDIVFCDFADHKKASTNN